MVKERVYLADVLLPFATLVEMHSAPGRRIWWTYEREPHTSRYVIRWRFGEDTSSGLAYIFDDYMLQSDPMAVTNGLHTMFKVSLP